MNQKFFQILAVASISAIIFAHSVGAEDHDSIMAKMAEKKDEHILDEMNKNLNLTSDQEAAIKSVLASQRDKNQDLRKDFETKQKALANETDKQIVASLSDGQKAKYPDVKAQLQEEEAKKGQGENYHKGSGGAGSQGGFSGGGRHHGGGMGGGF